MTRAIGPALGPGGYAGHSGDLGTARRPRGGPSAGTLVAVIVAVVVVAVCVGAGVALWQQEQGRRTQSLESSFAAATVPEVSSNDGESGRQGTP
jgi:hypothetical protein